ncbi:MAG: cyclopentanone 1,2-monooxygenase [Burkholderiales bacterium 66-5]|nr:MAG: cyclopentanone 1,2-monooxygenase [Burkholderiales bacterium 66-5]
MDNITTNNSVNDTLDVLIIGAGFTGLYQLHALRERGFKVHLVDAAKDVGGIWHWNCYPGARVDTHCQIYQYSMPELWQEFEWRERFPNWEQMREYFKFVDRKLDLSRSISFGARVRTATFDEDKREWTVYMLGHQPIRARYVVANLGFAAKPYIPKIEGMDRFKGEIHHTALWPQGGLDMTGKRVAVIGTGASGVQVSQEAALVAKRLTTFQRTPNLAIPMHNQQYSAEDNRAMRPELPAAFERCRNAYAGFDFDFIPKNATEVSAEERQATLQALWDKGGFYYWLGNFQDYLFDEKANDYVYDFWRDKVRARINDPQVADKLAPMKKPHPWGAKRPCLEQWYYEIFNQDNVKLVDLGEKPILGITEKGIVTADGETEFDIIALATGFDGVSGGLTNIDFRDGQGRTFKEKWSSGVRTHLGVSTAGFPNLLFGYGPQSPAGFCNGPTSAEVQGELLVDLLCHLRDKGITRVEATEAAQEDWFKLVEDFWAMSLFPKAKSWYQGANIPGKTQQSLNFPNGLPTYTAKFKEAAANGYACFALN